MMEIYPFGGLAAYLKYHFLDGVSKQSLMLTDKTRYNHGKKVSVASKPKSNEEAEKISAKYGIGDVRREIGD